MAKMIKLKANGNNKEYSFNNNKVIISDCEGIRTVFLNGEKVVALDKDKLSMHQVKKFVEARLESIRRKAIISNLYSK